jgi:aminoglycoside/choline kinase family phosphotransferase
LIEDREAAIARLMEATGFAGATRAPLPGDASTRRYERLIAPARCAMLMDAPRNAESGPCPPEADESERLALGWNAVARLAASRVEAFAAVADHLRTHGLSAPEIFGIDAPNGLAIVEDLGDGVFARVIEEGEDEIQLYCAAADVLAQLHAVEPPKIMQGLGGPWPLLDYDRLALIGNADLFLDWIPAAIGAGPVSDQMRARWEALRDNLVDQAMQFPRAFTIRDYHAENLIWLPQRDGVRRVGILDFQDALRGWATWDFAMLLQDARRDVSTLAAEAAIARYLRRTGMTERAFRAELAVLGALNALRILGVFARLVHRDGKARYSAFMPREWRHLSANLRHPDLAELQDFVTHLAAPYLEPAA